MTCSSLGPRAAARKNSLVRWHQIAPIGAAWLVIGIQAGAAANGG
jgi:hypothetical protein